MNEAHIMAAEEGWNFNSPIEIKGNPDYKFSEEEIAARAFKIEQIIYKGRVIKFVSIESKFVAQKAKIADRDAMSVIVPDDWKQQVAEAMQDTSLVFVSYFPPELEKTAYNSRFFGIKARSWGDQILHDVYQSVADLAAKQGKPVAVADIGNKAAYGIYEFNPPNRALLRRDLSAYGIPISSSERYLPQAVDARRMFTTKGIMQTVEEYPQGSTFMYVAAPAHVNRVRSYLTKPPTLIDRLRYELYVTTMPGLDTSTRIYQHSDNGWSCVSDIPYCKPGKRLIPILMTAGVATGIALARRAKNT